MLNAFQFAGSVSMQTQGSVSSWNKILPIVATSIITPPQLPTRDLSKEIIDLNLWRTPQQLPSSIIPIEFDPTFYHEIQNPETPKIEKQAARMIVIRRRKMKKHKIKKLRKRRKFEYRRIALKRKTLKEKLFQMKLSDQIKEAEKFDPKTYVDEMIRKANEEFIDTRPPWNPSIKRNPALQENGKRIKLLKIKKTA